VNESIEYNLNKMNNDELTRTDDLLLGDQNEIVLTNDAHIDSLSTNISLQINANNADNEDNEASVDLFDDDADGDENSVQSAIAINSNQQSDSSNIPSTNSLPSSSIHSFVPSHHRTHIITSTRHAVTLDDSAPPTATSTYISYRKDHLTPRKLLDIRSQLLLNTTLDATEV